MGYKSYCCKNLAICLGFLAITLSLSACSSLGLETDKTYSDKAKEKLYENGSLASDEGGIFVFGGDRKKSENNGLGVNGFLWRATLDTVSFMPLASADPFGGVIVTDWYSAPDATNERIKMNILILDRDLRADGIKVTVFRQERPSANKDWVDAKVSPTTATSIEESILTRARQLRLAQREQSEQK